jgi:hypothetical protein
MEIANSGEPAKAHQPGMLGPSFSESLGSADKTALPSAEFSYYLCTIEWLRGFANAFRGALGGAGAMRAGLGFFLCCGQRRRAVSSGLFGGAVEGPPVHWIGGRIRSLATRPDSCRQRRPATSNFHRKTLIDIKGVAAIWRFSVEAFCSYSERKTAHG